MNRFACSKVLLLLFAVGCSRDDVKGDSAGDTGTRRSDDTGERWTDDTGPLATDDTAPYGDEDADGYASNEDCDDANPAVNPGALETCDGLDQDCDGEVDEDAADAATWYRDQDGDGSGNVGTTAAGCTAPDGYVAEAGDCDDTDAAFHPGADEPDCTDPGDYNCDGSVGYADADGDGYAACVECDDASRAVNPSAVEVCNGVDDDCDGSIDGTDAIGTGAWYLDADGDGYGDATVAVEACDAPAGYVADATDCDDAEPAAHPGAVETCDGIDDDCDGDVDADATDASTWYIDYDGDGYGSRAYTETACEAPAGYVANASDCDDADEGSSPAGVEACDGADNDCDGTVDDPEEVRGDAAACAPTDCDDLLADRPTAADGLYWIDPDGAGALQAWCDMTHAGGGWTLVAKLSNQDDAHWATAESDWTDTAAYGTTTDLSSDADARSDAWGRLQARDFMLTDDALPDNYVATTDGCMRRYTPADYFTLALADFPNSAVSSDYFDTCSIDFLEVPGWAAEPDWSSSGPTSTNLSFDDGYVVIARTDSTDTAGVVSFYDTTINEADVGLGALESGTWATAWTDLDIGGGTSCGYSASECRSEYPETVYFWVR